ncbi:hypothetical protein Q3G72_032664 [Acer saccharum]|nr:hypothetical protein Q3G72_032664 [Acer saccharum]
MLSQPDSSGTMTSVTTMKGINDQILCMDYHNFKVQIFHANAQVSCNVKQTAASKTQEEAPKKSYASVVHDLNNSKSPFNVITRSPPAKPVHQLRTTASVAPEASAPSGNITMERKNDHAIKGHSIFIGNLPEIATVLPLIEGDF